MKTYVFLLLLAVPAAPVLAQQSLRYAVWADGLVNPQLPKSSLYFAGTGLRGEVSRPFRTGTNALFAQLGYAHFFQKATGAFVADIGFVTVGYRYQSRRAFMASAGVGAQYWRERMRVRFPDYTVDETFGNLLPGATLGLGLRLTPHYTLGLEYRGAVKPEQSRVVLRNTIALSIGYTF